MFTEEEIYYWSSGDGAYRRGEALYRQGAVPELKVTQEGNIYKARAYVRGSNGDRYYNCIEVDKDLKDEVYLECECLAALKYEGGCKHSVAMMFKMNEIFSRGQEEIQRLDRLHAQNLLTYYEEQMLQVMDYDTYNEVRLEPKLYDRGDGSFGLGLQVGKERLYVVKDMEAFVEAVLEEKEVTYGKQLRFVHHTEAFEASSRPLLELVLQQAADKKQVLQQVFGGRVYAHEKKMIELTPGGFDQLFTYYKDRWIALQDDYGTVEVKLEQRDPKFHFHITKEDDDFFVKSMVKHYQLIKHPTKHYLWTENCIACLSQGYVKHVWPVLKFMQEMYPPQLTFDEGGWRRFSVSILPKLKKYLTLEMEKDIETIYTPPALTIRVYLDQDEAKHIRADVVLDYEGYKINPYSSEPLQTQLTRDIQKEYAFNKILEKYPFKLSKGHLVLSDEEGIYALFHGGIEKLLTLSEVHMTDELKSIRFKYPVVGGIGIKLKGNLLQLQLEDMRLPAEEVQAILQAYRVKKKYYRLTDGSFVDLQDELLEELDDVLQGLGVGFEDFEEENIEVAKYRGLYLDHVLNKKQHLKVARDKEVKQMIRAFKSVEDSDYEVPEALKHVLRSYQKIGYRWLRTMSYFGFGGILADDMGLGKTLQVLALLKAYKDEERHLASYKPSIVVAPTSLVLNWEKECMKFTPDMKAKVISGSAKVREEDLKQSIEAGVDLIITSYDLLKRDEGLYSHFQFKYCIADEAHAIKNPKTQNAKAIKKIKSDLRFGLSGTPIENTLAELWSLFDFCMPGYLFHYSRFKASFETPIMRMEDTKAMQRLQKMTAPFILRRLKKDVLKELPPKTETIIYNEMEGEQLKLYKAHMALVQNELRKELQDYGLGKSRIKILAMLTRLRQLCCHPGLYLQDYTGESAKLEQCMTLIQEALAGGHKLLLFSQFTTMLDKIGERLLEEGIAYYLLTGQTKIEKRMEMVDAFNTDETPVFLISLKAGGTGLNLTAADMVIHYDPWWNVSSEHQATDRVHRIGQERPVQVYKLITKDTIEERIKVLQDKKILLSEQILKEEQVWLDQMTQEQLISLFED